VLLQQPARAGGSIFPTSSDVGKPDVGKSVPDVGLARLAGDRHLVAVARFTGLRGWLRIVPHLVMWATG